MVCIPQAEGVIDGFTLMADDDPLMMSEGWVFGN